MLVKLMRTFHYDSSGRNCRHDDTQDPTWAQIVSAIRALDKFQNPFVWLYLSPSATTSDMPEFEIIGGNGDYVTACSIKGHHQRMPCYPERGNKLVDVWTSDQGTAIPAKYVIHDINLVLEVTQFFCQQADYSPAMKWDEWKR